MMIVYSAKLTESDVISNIYVSVVNIEGNIII